MSKKHKQIENTDISILRRHIDGLKQAQSETGEDIRTGDATQQQAGRIQQNRLTHQIQTVEDQIEEMNTLLSEGPVSQDGTISIGYVVTIRIDGGQAKTYILVHESGGQKLSGKTMLSIGTPVGRALIGRRVNEVFSVEVGDDQIMIEILASDVFA